VVWSAEAYRLPARKHPAGDRRFRGRSGAASSPCRTERLAVGPLCPLCPLGLSGADP